MGTLWGTLSRLAIPRHLSVEGCLRVQRRLVLPLPLANSLCSKAPLNDESIHTSGKSRWAAILGPVLILLAAIFYYGSYIRFDFNPHDEGGTAALIASRMLAGEVPFKDIELGYNVGWFWPIVGLFKAVGVNFVAMRGFFFLVSTLCALWGWAVVRKVTRREWLAILIGLVLVIFPGSQFKNYIPMLCVANTLALVTAALGSGISAAGFWRRIVLGGIVLGITFLVRIDIGYLFSVIWLGFVFLRLFDHRTTRGIARLGDVIAGAAVLAASVLLVLGPATLVTKAGGYESEFLDQYRNWADFISGRAESVVAQSTAKPAATATAEQPKKTGVRKVDRTELQRVSWETFKTSSDEDKRVLFILTYVPVAIFILLVTCATLRTLGAIFRGTFTLDHPGMLSLLLLGGSLTTFPQFFFFRPDRPHLSEFMPGFIVATVSAFFLMKGRLRWLVGALLAIQFGFFAWFAFDHYSAGTIAARFKIKKNKRVLFEGEDGVRVFVHAKEHEELEKIRKAVAANSKPGEWLVCYPYQPGYNVMTNRPTYERELYQDNATAPGGWAKGAIARIEEKKPAVVIIDDRAINQVENSRFSKWAPRVYEYLQTNYEVCAQTGSIEVYRRKAPADAPTPAPAPAQ